jgi:hypothetical protein
VSNVMGSQDFKHLKVLIGLNVALSVGLVIAFIVMCIRYTQLVDSQKVLDKDLTDSFDIHTRSSKALTELLIRVKKLEK